VNDEQTTLSLSIPCGRGAVPIPLNRNGREPIGCSLFFAWAMGRWHHYRPGDLPQSLRAARSVIPRPYLRRRLSRALIISLPVAMAVGRRAEQRLAM